MSVVIVFLVVEVRDRRKEVKSLNNWISEIASRLIEKPDASRVLALEIENRAMKAEIEELKARRRSEVRPTSSAGAMKKFRAEMRGAEIEG